MTFSVRVMVNFPLLVIRRLVRVPNRLLFLPNVRVRRLWFDSHLYDICKGSSLTISKCSPVVVVSSSILVSVPVYLGYGDNGPSVGTSYFTGGSDYSSVTSVAGPRVV